MDFPPQQVRPTWEKNISRPASVRVIPLANMPLKWCMCEAGSKHLLNGLHQSPSCPLGSSAQQNCTSGTRYMKPGRTAQFCFLLFLFCLTFPLPEQPPLILWQQPAERQSCAINSQSTARNFTATIQDVIWSWNHFLNVVSDGYFTSLVRPELHSHQVTIAHNRMQPLPLPRVHCWGPTLLKWFTRVIAVNAALSHIPETPSARETSCQLRSGLQGRILHNCSGLKLASMQQQVEDKRKAFVFRCEERFAIIYCQD